MQGKTTQIIEKLFIPATLQVLLDFFIADINIHTAKYICKFVFLL